MIGWEDTYLATNMELVGDMGLACEWDIDDVGEIGWTGWMSYSGVVDLTELECN